MTIGRIVRRGANYLNRARRLRRRLGRKNEAAVIASLSTDRIHYACGAKVLDGWLNVDGFLDFAPTPDSRGIYWMDLTDRHPIRDAHWRYGYAEDFLEHLNQAESLVFLSECYRTFAAGGVLRLSFPSLEQVLKRHLRATDFEGAKVAQKEAYEMWQHEHFYSFDELRLVADHLGWSAIRVVEFGESDHAPLRGIDTRVNQVGLNLIVELTR